MLVVARQDRDGNTAIYCSGIKFNWEVTLAGNRAFLSHGGDDADLVSQFASALELSGIQVFLDKWDIRPGQPIWNSIDRAMDKSSWMILFLSRNTLSRKGVLEELDRGYQKAYELHGEEYLVPVALDEMGPLLPSLPLGIRMRNILPAYEYGFDKTVARLKAIINSEPTPRESVPEPVDFYYRVYDYSAEQGVVVEIATPLPVLADFGCETVWTAPVMFPRFNWGPPNSPEAIIMPDSWGGTLSFGAGNHWSHTRFDTRWHISFHSQAITRSRSFYMAFKWAGHAAPETPPFIALFDAWGNVVRDPLPRHPRF